MYIYILYIPRLYLQYKKRSRFQPSPHSPLLVATPLFKDEYSHQIETNQLTGCCMRRIFSFLWID